jgi:hypothetical protein
MRALRVARPLSRVGGVRWVERAVGPGALVAQQCLHDAPRHPAFRQRGRLGVPLRMDGGLVGDATLAHHRCEGLLEGGGGQGC